MDEISKLNLNFNENTYKTCFETKKNEQKKHGKVLRMQNGALKETLS